MIFSHHKFAAVVICAANLAYNNALIFYKINPEIFVGLQISIVDNCK
jgi:hypothetical protein